MEPVKYVVEIGALDESVCTPIDKYGVDGIVIAVPDVTLSFSIPLMKKSVRPFEA
jgi:hypothetical protein